MIRIFGIGRGLNTSICIPTCACIKNIFLFLWRILLEILISILLLSFLNRIFLFFIFLVLNSSLNLCLDKTFELPHSSCRFYHKCISSGKGIYNLVLFSFLFRKLVLHRGDRWLSSIFKTLKLRLEISLQPCENL